MASWWRVDKHISRAVKSIFNSANSNDLIFGQSESELRTGGVKLGEKLRVPNGTRLIVIQGSLVCKKENEVIKVISPSRSLNEGSSITNYHNEEIYVVNNDPKTATYSIG